MGLRKLRNVTIETACFTVPAVRGLFRGGIFHRLGPKPASHSGYIARLHEYASGSRPMPRKLPHLTEWIPHRRLSKLKKRQQREPVSLGTKEGKTYWWYKDEFYVDRDGCTAEEVKLLLMEGEERRREFENFRREILAERAIMGACRGRIPQDIRVLVCKRDGGGCVKCGSEENLEFDHIIPVSKGGSDTASNIRVLCQTCKRKESDQIRP